MNDTTNQATCNRLCGSETCVRYNWCSAVFAFEEGKKYRPLDELEIAIGRFSLLNCPHVHGLMLDMHEVEQSLIFSEPE